MKSGIREQINRQRLSMSNDENTSKSEAIVSRLQGLPQFKDAKSALFYISKKGEVDTHELVKKALGNKHVIVPKTIKEPLGLKLCEITSWDTLKPGMFGILESIGICDIDPQTIDLAIVPGVAFDELGFRVGHGFGFYDRLLAGMKAFKIGLAYGFQVVEDISPEEHDIKVDMIITEDRIITP